MKKLLPPISVFLSLIALCLSLGVAYPAMVVFRWNPDYAPKINGLPAVAVKLYYGGQLKTYTNFVVAPITNLTLIPYNGYDQYNCVSNTVVNYVTIPIYGLGVE